MTHPGFVLHMDFCLELCAQSNECNSITFANDGYCSHFTSNCNKRTSMSGAVSFQVKPFSTRAVYDKTDCDKNCKIDHSKFIPKTSGYVRTLKDCLESCSDNADCEGITFFDDGYCSHFGNGAKETQTMKSACYKKKADVNECLTNNGGCDSKRTCTNTDGSMKCEDCPAGYANDGAKGCKEVSCSSSSDVTVTATAASSQYSSSYPPSKSLSAGDYWQSGKNQVTNQWIDYTFEKSEEKTITHIGLQGYEYGTIGPKTVSVIEIE